MDKVECKNCSSVYQMSSTRVPMRDKDYLSCEVCGEQYFSWNEAKFWGEKLIEKRENHLKKA